MKKDDFKSREEFLAWVEQLGPEDHELGEPAPEKDAQPGDEIVLEFEQP
jgi:hypothetical protein